MACARNRALFASGGYQHHGTIQAPVMAVVTAYKLQNAIMPSCHQLQNAIMPSCKADEQLRPQSLTQHDCVKNMPSINDVMSRLFDYVSVRGSSQPSHSAQIVPAALPQVLRIELLCNKLT